MSLPQVSNGANIPGALLFITYKPKTTLNGGKKYSGVAYDPYAQQGDTPQSLTARYKSQGAFPYYELFTQMDQNKDKAADWDKQGKTYMGLFGKNPGPIGNVQWPYANETNSAIRDGVFISYWNKTSGRGCETNGVGQPFGEYAETNYMALHSGNGTDLLSAAGISSNTFLTITLDWYAMKSGTKMNL